VEEAGCVVDQMLAGRDEGVERNKKRMNAGGVQCGWWMWMLAWLSKED
jgi:hypothetical protein